MSFLPVNLQKNTQWIYLRHLYMCKKILQLQRPPYANIPKDRHVLFLVHPCFPYSRLGTIIIAFYNHVKYPDMIYHTVKRNPSAQKTSSCVSVPESFDPQTSISSLPCRTQNQSSNPQLCRTYQEARGCWHPTTGQTSKALEQPSTSQPISLSNVNPNNRLAQSDPQVKSITGWKKGNIWQTRPNPAPITPPNQSTQNTEYKNRELKARSILQGEHEQPVKQSDKPPANTPTWPNPQPPPPPRCSPQQAIEPAPPNPTTTKP